MTPVMAWAAGNGDRVVRHAPAGSEALQILEVRYQPIAVQPFAEPPGAALFDASLIKKVRMAGTELQLRFECHNVLNRRGSGCSFA